MNGVLDEPDDEHERPHQPDETSSGKTKTDTDSKAGKTQKD